MERAYPIVKKRRVIRLGSSLYVSMPNTFVRRYALKKGNQVAVTAGEVMKVIPFQDCEKSSKGEEGG